MRVSIGNVHACIYRQYTFMPGQRFLMVNFQVSIRVHFFIFRTHGGYEHFNSKTNVILVDMLFAAMTLHRWIVGLS